MPSKAYHRKKSKEHYYENYIKYKEVRKKRADESGAIIQQAKIDAGGCKMCPEKEPCALDFHHPDLNKDRTIANMRNYSREKIFEEISKCVVLCANCHRKVHAGVITV